MLGFCADDKIISNRRITPDFLDLNRKMTPEKFVLNRKIVATLNIRLVISVF
jgi:hypothetical protein